MTTSTPQSCPQCGATIPEGSADGLCPRCVFSKAMAPTADGGSVPHVPPSLESVRAAFPHLEITGLIGSGGMGAVFKARQPQLDRFVALKILPTELADQPGFSERFQREAQALARLSHPHIVTIHDFGQAGGFYFLLMEFIDGVNLRQLLQAKRLTPKEALSIVPPICDALQCAHDHGIVHRDIKPENLLIDKAGVVKIADFGIAKMIAAPAAEGASGAAGAPSSPATMALGTPDYAAPEQRDASAATDHRADIYSLGVVLYEMLTGERPTEKLEAPSKRVQVDIRIDEIVLRALEKTPELRFQTAAEFRTQVESMANPPAARTTAPQSTASSIALAVVLLILGILIPVVGIQMHNNSVRAAAADHVRFIRTLQDGVASLSDQIGEANTVAGRAAVRGDNRAEPEETRAQAREERRVYLQRSASLQADMKRLFAALTAAGNEQVDPHSWRAVSLLATGLLLALVGGGMLVRIQRRSGAGRTMEPGAPAVGGSAQGITTAALFIVWWFAAFSLVALCASAGLLATMLCIVVMLIAMPVFAMLARVKAQQWRAASDAESGPRGLRAFSWVGWVFAIPAVGLALFFFYSLASESGSWNPARSEAVMVPLAFLGVVLLPWAAAHLWQVSRFRAGTSFPTAVEAVRPTFKYAALLLLVPVLFIGMLVVTFNREASSPAGVTNFDVKPVEVRGNVVVVDVTTDVARGYAELRVVLDGRRLPDATEAALADTFSPPFAGTFIKPAPHAGNQPWFILSPGRQTQRLGFVLPDAASAKVAFDNLRPIGPLPAVAGRTFAGTLFSLQQSEGEDYHALLQVAPPLTTADPKWVSVSGGSQSNESDVTLTWEVQASRPGLAQFSRAGSPIKTLARNPQTKLYGVSAKLELAKVGADRVRFVRRLGHSAVREEFSGDFRELADELRRTQTTSAKTVAGTVVELCQFQGKPFTVQVQTQGGPLETSVFAPVEMVAWTGPSIFLLLVGIVVITLIVVLARKGVSAGKIVLLVLGVPFFLAALIFAVLVGSYAQLSTGTGHVGVSWIGLVAIGAVILLIIAAGITLLVVLSRKGGSAGKIVGFIVGGMLLLLAIAVAVIPAVRRISRDFGPGASVAQLPQPGQSSAAPDAAQLEKPLTDGSLPDARILVYAATGIEHGWVQIQSRLNPEHELAFFLGDEGSGWSHVVRYGEKGDYQFFIEKSDAIALEGGGKGRGFLIRSGPAGDSDRAKSIAYVAMEPGGTVPAGRLTFRTRELNVTDNTTRITFADIVTPDGQRIPMTARVRPLTQAAPSAKSTELEVRAKK